MHDEKLARNLQSVGQSCYVKYYSLFSSARAVREDIIEKLKSDTDYTEKSCISRTGHALSIINAGRGIDALNMVIHSDSPKVSEETRNLASKHISSCS